MQTTEDRFYELLNRYFLGELSQNEKAVLFKLLEESEKYNQIFEDYAKVNALLYIPEKEKSKDFAWEHFKKRIIRKSSLSQQTSLFKLFRYVAAAMTFIVLGSALTYSFMKKDLSSSSDMLCETIVPFGCTSKVVLPDSTIVVLNSGSILKYPISFAKGERNIYLEGEGYFDVKRDDLSPFSVKTKQIKVEVLGTTFNLRSYDNEVNTKVSLIKGTVEVLAQNKKIMLKSDQQLTYNSISKIFEKTEGLSSKSALWTTGKMSFVNTPFLDLLKNIERKYNVKININSTLVKNEIFSGTINSGMSLQEVFDFIDMDNKYKFELLGNVILLSER